MGEGARKSLAQDVDKIDPQEREEWHDLQKSICQEILKGKTTGKWWSLTGIWVDLADGRMFAVEDLVRDMIRDEIAEGAVCGPNWRYIEGRIRIAGGAAIAWNEPLPRINEERIENYFKAHGLRISAEDLRQIRKKIFSYSDEDAKTELKRIIRERRLNGKIL